MKQRVLAMAAASLLPAIFLSALWLFRPVRAATFDVCASSCPYTAISQAVDDLSNVPDGSTINVLAGTYTDTVVVMRDLTIQGQGAGITIVDGEDAGSVFEIGDEITFVTVTIKDITIRNGTSSNGGGGIYNDVGGVLTVTNTIIQNNEADCQFEGGGVANYGVMAMQAVTITNNNATFGAGVFNGGSLTAENVAITLNYTDETLCGDKTGGGIENDTSATLSLINSIVSENTAAGDGAGIENAGTLTVSFSTINANSSAPGILAGGGGISNIVGGTATIISSTVSANSADFGGGINNAGTLWLTSSVVYDNAANNSGSSSGGGIRNESGGVLTVTNSTVSGNIAVEGGGLFNEGSGATAVLRSATFYNNSGSFAGNIYNITGTVTLSNTIIAISPLGADCFGSGVISGGSNLDSDGSCGLGAGELSAIADPKIGPLQDNGGPTWTRALLLTSPAIDAADVCEATDQRGIARPVGDACDIGAYETGAYEIYLPAILKQ